MLLPELPGGEEDLVETVCSICLENFPLFPVIINGETKTVTELPVERPCGHIFHPACILRSFISDLMTNGGDGVEVEINNTRGCPLCRTPFRLDSGSPRGRRRWRWTRREADEFMMVLPHLDVRACRLPHRDGRRLYDRLFSLNLRRRTFLSPPAATDFSFRLMAAMVRIQEMMVPRRPCLPEHRLRSGTFKFCYKCSPSCKICGNILTMSCCPRIDHKNEVCVSFSDSGLQSVQDYFFKYSSSGCLDPVWRAKDDLEDRSFFCDTCFWMRPLVVGLGHTGSPCNRFERLEFSSFLRMRSGSGCSVEEPSDSDGQNGARDECGNCESCGDMLMFPNNRAIRFVDDWCSKCRPQKPAPVDVDDPVEQVEPSESVNPAVLVLHSWPTRTAPPGFLAPRSVPVAPVPSTDTSSATSAPEISGALPNSKPKAEPKAEPKSEPKRKPKPGSERVILEQSGNVDGNDSEEVGRGSHFPGGMAQAFYMFIEGISVIGLDIHIVRSNEHEGFSIGLVLCQECQESRFVPRGRYIEQAWSSCFIVSPISRIPIFLLRSVAVFWWVCVWGPLLLSSSFHFSSHAQGKGVSMYATGDRKKQEV